MRVAPLKMGLPQKLLSSIQFLDRQQFLFLIERTHFKQEKNL